MDCSKDMIGRVNLDRWRQLSPNFVVPDEMLHESIERAKRDLGEMRHTEWNLHEHRESTSASAPFQVSGRAERQSRSQQSVDTDSLCRYVDKV